MDCHWCGDILFPRCSYIRPQNFFLNWNSLGSLTCTELIVHVWPAQISYLEVEVETLTEQLHSHSVVCEEDQNGSVTVDDLDHIQKVNRELEQQLTDKNRVSHYFWILFLIVPVAFNRTVIRAPANVLGIKAGALIKLTDAVCRP